MSKKKFEFKLEEDRGFIVHNEKPRCKALLGDDDDLFDEIDWLHSTSEDEKETVVEEMTDWYLHEFQNMPRED